MSNIFQSVQTPNKHYNNFNLGREVLVSGQIGKLIPVQCDEVVPGDRFRQSAAFLCRFAPLSAPAMARFNVHFHTFYVPYRILTDEAGRESTYERFIKSIGKASEEVPMLPRISCNIDDSEALFNVFNIGSLADYLGYPTNQGRESLYIDPDDGVSLMPFLAYQRIYQDFYRRDQIEQEVVFPINVGNVSLDYEDWDDRYDDFSFEGIELTENQRFANKSDLFDLHTRNYERDYFTSALPEPQFGDEVTVGDGLVNWIGGKASLTTGLITSDLGLGSQPLGYSRDASWMYSSNPVFPAPFILGSNDGSVSDTEGASTFYISGVDGTNFASHLQANQFTINELRLAMQLQGVLEQINRSGTRYLEIMRGIYGVTVPDARLQRPIYLGGFKNPVTIGSVMQTSETGTTPQGTLTGQMSAAGSNRLCSGGYEFKEHGYLLTIMSITPRTSYYGGMPRKFTKKYPEDFYLPQFDHLGEQEIKRGELYFDFNEGTYNQQLFGYTPRYAELKSSLSSVHGEFRTTLDNWHVSRDFDTSPALSADFIKADPRDFERIFAFNEVAGTSNEHFYMQIYLDVVAKRNMSKYSTPYTFY